MGAEVVGRHICGNGMGPVGTCFRSAAPSLEDLGVELEIARVLS